MYKRMGMGRRAGVSRRAKRLSTLYIRTLIQLLFPKFCVRVRVCGFCVRVLCARASVFLSGCEAGDLGGG